MVAFVPGATAGAFTATNPALQKRACPSAAPRMAFNEGPPSPSLYLSSIPIDRLNKAPLIQITTIPGTGEHNYISVELVDMARDEGAGETVRAGASGMCDPSLTGAAPSPALYSTYYPQETLHEAPMISLVDGGTELTRSMTIIQCETPTSIANGEAVLGDGVPPNPLSFSKMNNATLNQAPHCEALRGASDEESTVNMPMHYVPLDYVGAVNILNKYRK